MIVAFTPQSFDEYLYWQGTDKKMLSRINELIKEGCRTPGSGRGKPEALRFDLSGCWSRRIDREHRLVYRVEEESGTLLVLSCRYHH